MNMLQAIVLGLVQGLTEFIPVSSSGHLVILHQAFGINDGGLTFDVALHIGTLLALVLYFHKDLLHIGTNFARRSHEDQTIRMLVLATIPAVIAGVLLQSAAESSFRSPRLVAINLFVFALVMMAAEHYSARKKQPTELTEVNRRQATIMGLAQAAAIVPGVSRSGSTITAGLFAGLDRVAATHFSFLLAIPITLGAILKVLLNDAAIVQVQKEPGLFLVGIITALFSGLFAIRFLLAFLSKHSLAVFAYYRIILAALVLILATR